MMSHKVILVALGSLAGLLLSVAWVTQSQAAEKVIYMQAMEPKGKTSVGNEPFPGNSLPSGGGYVIVPPNAKGKWTVSTYIWNPTQIFVQKGDRVTLKIIGLHGAKHTGSIEFYHPADFMVKRGRITTVKFTATKAGRFKIRCSDHQPTMTGELIVFDN